MNSKKIAAQVAHWPVQQALAEQLSRQFHPILARVYAARSIDSSEELELGLAGLPSPAGLKGITAAVAILTQALRSNGRILVVGDFDADGATGCAVAMLALQALGAREVHYLVPNRFDYGYGLSPEIVEVAVPLDPQVLITVDNGISSVEGVAAACEKGIQVIVTDHHLPPDQLPAADAIVNPNQVGDEFEAKSLSGVGVIFYLMLALRTHLRDIGWFQEQEITEPNLSQWLDLVAVGTVADMVPLGRTNRILVSQGLARINAGRCRPGIKALLRLSNRRLGRIVASDLGFVVAPRLNAAGRLDDISLGIETLLANESGQAERMARVLDDWNRERRKIEASMQEQARKVLGDIDTLQRDPSHSVCLYHQDWHQGVIGLLASRLKELTGKPVAAFAPEGEGMLKGSLRSVPGVHIRDVLASIATRRPDILRHFGGHAMAAGMSLHIDHFSAFRDAFEAEVGAVLGDVTSDETVFTDGELHESDFNLELADLLRQAGPWGQGFPEPRFHGVFNVLEQRIVGEQHLKLKLKTENGTVALDAIAFRYIDPGADPPKLDRIQAIYRLDVNEFRGLRSPQLIIDEIQALDD